MKTCAYLNMHRYVFKYLASSPRAAGYMNFCVLLDISISLCIQLGMSKVDAYWCNEFFSEQHRPGPNVTI